ncbi:hypothetical protein MY04_5447 [Flammeovirga sp. MY04]|uniref:YncE family protein n=1 Tax=Flammeovirga sp. MY04 TaxID=1191459 RepID=UPI000825652D|nr:DUF5074 domain-containing protein [Flammeovirga sp. MY04]ANQ52778.2 hypothetical protein MY04_5447 [Flammeovirga sp. MY04]
MKYIIYIAFFSLIACNSVEDSMPISTEKEVEEDVTFKEGVYVVNEGNFDWGVATLSHKRYDSDTVNNELYKSINNFELGNVAQSMTLIGDEAYICVNNSARIDIMEETTGKWIDRIEIPNSSPRYLHQVDEKKAYVTDLYSDKIYVVDLKKNEVIKNIASTGWTEKMCQLDQFVYVTETKTVFDRRKGGQLLLKLDTNTDEIVDSLKLPIGPIDIVKDKDNMLWVLCNGGLEELQPALVQVDPATFSITKSFSLSADDYLSMPSRLRINKEGDQLYFIQRDVIQQDIYADHFDRKVIVPKGKRLFYGLGVNPRNNEIYVTDAIDYVQKGWVFRYSDMGVKLDSFQVGVIPNEIVFQ